MTNLLTNFEPTRAAGLERLKNFAPDAGQRYAIGRNYEGSAKDPGAVSALSPYLRSGVLSQSEVLRAVLVHHSPKEADRFIAEVLWRSYWQGWLALRPAVWDSYQADLKHLFNQVQTQSGLRQRWQSACLGQTGIAPFDAWAHDLVRSGYLHNHARMWFASIWVHTLELPWQLGADFFLRHLLDGCPASNTLGWKWVAGLQTIGKPYIATPENIAKFTHGRFTEVTGLAGQAAPLAAPAHPDPTPLWDTRQPDRALPTGLILHEDNLNPAHILTDAPPLAGHVTLIATADQTPWQMAPHVGAFREKAAQDMHRKLADRIGPASAPLTSAQALKAWAQDQGFAQLITADAPVGPTKTMLDAYDTLSDGPPLIRARARLDATAWPLATAGFFKFRAHIPKLLGLIT